jgi:hypothetical protein
MFYAISKSPGPNGHREKTVCLPRIWKDGRVMLMRREPPAEELEAYLGLKPEEIAQIVLLLLMQESVGERLHALLSQSSQSPLKPAA